MSSKTCEFCSLLIRSAAVLRRSLEDRSSVYNRTTSSVDEPQIISTGMSLGMSVVATNGLSTSPKSSSPCRDTHSSMSQEALCS